MSTCAACRPRCCYRCMTSWCSRRLRKKWRRCALWSNRRWRASSGWTCRWWWTWAWETTGAMQNRILACLLMAMTLAAQKRTVSDAEVKRVHASALLIDTHDDFPTEQTGNDRPAGSTIDIGVPSPKAHTDLARLRQGRGGGGVLCAEG